MIAVSNEFKKAIKNPERKIKGYVEVLYDLPQVEYTASASTYIPSTYTLQNEITDGNRTTNTYGSLDYLPLDGTRLTMSSIAAENTNSGYISDDLFENLTTPGLTINIDNSVEIKGVTLYFGENPLTDFEIFYSDGSHDIITNNENEVVQVIFETPRTLSWFSLDITGVMYQDRKIHIDEIDLGVTQVYKDQDLIQFTVDEEVSKLVEEVPINETNIILNNMTDLFNPLNPSGIVPYLSENTLIRPYIGVLTENLGVEYVKMGEFYFDSYTNNSDATTTLVGKNIIKQVEKDEITDGLVGLTSTFIDLVNGEQENTTTAILDRLKYDYVFNPRQQIGYYLHFLDDISLINYFKDIASHDFSMIYANRNGTIIIRNPISNIVDSLTKQELIKDAEYKQIERINTIKRKSKRSSSDSEYKQGNNVTIFSSTDNQFVFSKTTENFAVSNNVSRDVWALNTGVVFTYTGATTAEIKCGSNKYTIIQATGNVGDTVSFNCVVEDIAITEKTLEETYTVTNKLVGEKESIIEHQSTLNAFPGAVRTNLGQLEYTPGYEMSFEYNGDPSLEAGDYINVETPYGYKPLFIQKNRFKFDGGLEGSIEGVE